MNLFNLALRNLDRQRRRTLLLGGAIAFGVLVIGVLHTVAASLTANVEENLFDASGGSAFFSGQELSPTGRVIPVLRDPSQVVEALDKAGLKPAASELRASSRVGLVGQGTADLTLTGLDPRALGKLAERVEVLTGTWPEPGAAGIILPQETAARLGVFPGDPVLVRAQTITGQENLVDLTVAAIVEDPAAFGPATAYAPLPTVNQLLNLPEGAGQTLSVTWGPGPRPTSAELRELLSAHLPLAPEARPLDALASLAGSLRTSAGAEPEAPWTGVRIAVRTLDEAMAPLLSVVDTLELVNVGVVTLVLVIILVGISNTFRMILLERTREIGTLRALGMHRNEVQAVLVAEAFLLALGGIVVGTLAAAAASVALGAATWASQAGNVGGVFFRGGRLGAHFAWSQAVPIAAVALVCVAAAWGPARKAARIAPAEALRTQN